MSIVDHLRENFTASDSYPRFKVEHTEMAGGLVKVTLYELEEDFLEYVEVTHSIYTKEDAPLMGKMMEVNARLIS